MSRPRRLWLWVAGSSIVAIGTAGALAWVVFASSLLAVDDIKVVGQRRLTESAVTQAAGVPQGIPLARVDLDAVRKRVGNLRVVESVRVSRVWPSTVRIEVRERVAVAAVPHGSGYTLLDDDGVRVATVAQPPDGLPVVRIRPGGPGGPSDPGGSGGSGGAGGSGSPSPPPGTAQGAAVRTSPGATGIRGGRGGGRGDRSASLSAAAKSAALRVVSTLPEDLNSQVRTVSVTADRKVTLYLRDGATVVWGQPERVREKVRILRALMRRADGATTYDVSSPEVVTTS